MKKISMLLFITAAIAIGLVMYFGIEKTTAPSVPPSTSQPVPSQTATPAVVDKDLQACLERVGNSEANEQVIRQGQDACRAQFGQ